MIPLIHLENNRLHSFYLKFIESFLNFQRRMMVEAFLTLVQVPPNILLKTRMVRERDFVRLSNARNLDFVHTFSPSKCKPQPHKGPTCSPRLSPRATSRTPRTPRSSHSCAQHRAEALSPYLVKECDRLDGREDGRHQWSVHMRHLQQHRHVA